MTTMIHKSKILLIFKSDYFQFSITVYKIYDVSYKFLINHDNPLHVVPIGAFHNFYKAHLCEMQMSYSHKVKRLVFLIAKYLLSCLGNVLVKNIDARS
jgi:hypothetical protein